jgi:hypothetical protein
MREVLKVVFWCVALLVAAPAAYAQQTIEVLKDPG